MTERLQLQYPRFRYIPLWICLILGASSFSIANEPDVGELISLVSVPSDEIPLRKIVESFSGFTVKDWDGESKDLLLAVAQATLESVEATGIKVNRVNEVSFAVEKALTASFRDLDWIADVPVALSGRRRSSGYPDLEVRGDEHLFYIEVKTYSLENENTTQRSFYVSPSLDFKVTQNAFHLLFGFVVEQREDDLYYISNYKIVDLYDLKCRLKYEFNASNRDLYEGGLQTVVP